MAMAPVALRTLCTPRSGRWTVAEPIAVARSTANRSEPSAGRHVDGLEVGAARTVP